MGRKSKYFRYLEKYVGTYKVLAEVDPDSNVVIRNNPTFEDLYIPCKYGVIKSTYEPDKLALYILDKPKVGNRIKTEFISAGIYFEDDSTDIDTLLYFKESDLDKVAKIIVPKTRGNKIAPFSVSNNKKSGKYEIPQEDMQRYRKLTESLDLDFADKVKYFRSILSKFDDIILLEKGDDFDIKQQRKELGLKSKEFIHYLGLWDKYLEFVQGEMNKR